MTTVGLLLCGAAALGMGTHSHAEPLAARVALSLSAIGENFYERTPVPFHVNVHNRTDHELAVNLVLQPVFRRFVQVLYRRVPHDFQALDYTSEWDLPGHPHFSPFNLSARQQKWLSLSLAADPGKGRFVFDRPGEYELRLICDVSREIGPNARRELLETPPLRIRIEPAPPSEEAALADWDVELAIFAQNDGAEGGPHFRREVTRALKFMDAHPSSLYARFLRQRTYDTLQLLQRQGAALSENEQDALAWLRRALREDP